MRNLIDYVFYLLFTFLLFKEYEFICNFHTSFILEQEQLYICGKLEYACDLVYGVMQIHGSRKADRMLQKIFCHVSNQLNDGILSTEEFICAMLNNIPSESSYTNNTTVHYATEKSNTGDTKKHRKNQISPIKYHNEVYLKEKRQVYCMCCHFYFIAFGICWHPSDSFCFFRLFLLI